MHLAASRTLATDMRCHYQHEMLHVVDSVLGQFVVDVSYMLHQVSIKLCSALTCEVFCLHFTDNISMWCRFVSLFLFSRASFL